MNNILDLELVKRTLHDLDTLPASGEIDTLKARFQSLLNGNCSKPNCQNICKIDCRSTRTY